MLNFFQKRHLFNILYSLENQKLPLDVFLSNYFRANKAIGAKDRRNICEAVYDIIRWRGLLDHYCPKPPSWEDRYTLYSQEDLSNIALREKIPSHIMVSFPKPLFQLIAASFGESRAIELCRISNTRAPTTVRVNALKISRENLFKKWSDLYPITLCPHSSYGIIFHQKINFFALQEFKDGLFEIQDEGSQLVAALIEAKSGDQVLDYCAGSGGKTLAFAPAMQNKGQIYLHDIRAPILKEAKKRLCRAGVQNAQILLPDDHKKSALKGRMDWVLADVPCSGTGTLRRNPDMKWKFDVSTFQGLVNEQRQIVKEALEFVHPKGRFVYATCSMLKEENEAQVKIFEREFELKLVKEPFQCFPEKDGKDGFFGAVFTR
jgi:16S rRNA (cytosine967-C5)-methyltransferase